MPKTYLTQIDRQDATMKMAISVGMAKNGIRFESDLARVLGLTPPAIAYHRRNGWRSLSVEQFGKLVRYLRMTGHDLADVFGLRP